MRRLLVILALCLTAFQAMAEGWIRFNQLGYLPGATKVAVYMGSEAPAQFTLIDAFTGEEVFRVDARPAGQILLDDKLTQNPGW